MQIIRNYKKKKDDIYCVAIGNFDGIHKGHLYLIDELKKSRKSKSEKLAIITFNPHPVKSLYPEKWKKNILKFRTKYSILKKSGLDALIILNFNNEFSSMTAENFIENILIDNFNVSSVVIGEDFRFGKDRKGDNNLLDKYSKKGFFNLICLKKMSYIDNVVSSSLIRKYIIKGDLKRSNDLLGYNWEVTGKVISGRAKGRELGFPTANLIYLYQISPENGIYACWVKIGNEKNWKQAAVSTGIRPQYNGNEKILEVHILEYNGNLYQKRLRIAFIKKIRNEEVFESENKLIKQMKQDCVCVRKILEKYEIKNNNGS